VALPQAHDDGDHHCEDQRDAERSRDRVDDRRLALEREERIRRAVAHAARVRAGNLEVLRQCKSRQEHRHDDETHGGDEETIRAPRQPAGREREDQVDEEDLGHPACRPPDRVEQLVAGLRQRRHEPSPTGGDEQQAEALVGAAVARVEPDRDRCRHHQRAGHRDQGGVVGGTSHGNGHADGDGDDARKRVIG
jgi:hypothetical protein